MGLWQDCIDWACIKVEEGWDSFGRSGVNTVTGGMLDRMKANRVAKRAQEEKEEILDLLEKTKKKTSSALTELGEVKASAYRGSLSVFVKSYKKVAKVDLSPLRKSKTGVSYKEFKVEMREMSDVTGALAVAGGGVIAGAATAAAAYGVAGIATTATFGSLSGIAASNATLAWLGGGSLASGGAGIAGGMAMLGGIALSPVLIAAMWYGTSKAKQQLNEAWNYSDKVDALREQVDTIAKEMNAVVKGAKLFNTVIESMDELMKYENGRLSTVVERLSSRSFFSRRICDPFRRLFCISILTPAESSIMRDAVNCAHLLKQFIDKPLMNEKGAFLEEAVQMLKGKRPECNTLLSQAGLPLLTTK